MDKGKKVKTTCKVCGRELFISRRRFERNDRTCRQCVDPDWYVQKPETFKWSFDPFDNLFVPGDGINPQSALVTGI